MSKPEEEKEDNFLETAWNFVTGKGDRTEMALDALTGDFMKKYGIVGGLAFAFFAIFKGNSLPMAFVGAGIISIVWGKALKPLYDNLKGKVTNHFNTAAGDDSPKFSLGYDDPMPEPA